MSWHLSERPKFEQKDEVEFLLDGDTNGKVYSGKITGVSHTNVLVDYWIVDVGLGVIENYEFSSVVVPHNHMRKKGDDRPFFASSTND